MSAPGWVRGAAPGWPGVRGVAPGIDGRGVGLDTEGAGTAPGTDGAGVGLDTEGAGAAPGTDGEGTPTGPEGSAAPGVEGPGALGAAVEGAAPEGGGAALPPPGTAPGICCAMLGDASPSRLPSKSMPTSRKRYLRPERLWDTASSSQLPDHAHTMLAYLLMQSFQREHG